VEVTGVRDGWRYFEHRQRDLKLRVLVEVQ